MAEFQRVRFQGFLSPVATDKPPSGGDWLHEIKFDGYRTQILVEDGKAAAFSKSGHDWSTKYRDIVSAAAKLNCKSAVLDGEIIVNNELGVSDFSRLPHAIKWEPHNLVFMAFDLLHLNDVDLRGQPLLARKRSLEQLLDGETWSIRYTEHLQTDGQSFFEACENLGLEGMVSKKASSIYRKGPNRNWLKTKCYTTSEFDVIGTSITSKGHHVALLKTRDHGKYVGAAFINLKRDKREEFRKHIQALVSDQPRLQGKKLGNAIWLKPGLVANVKHLRGEDGLRHASVLDIRRRDESSSDN